MGVDFYYYLSYAAEKFVGFGLWAHKTRPDPIFPSVFPFSPFQTKCC